MNDLPQERAAADGAEQRKDAAGIVTPARIPGTSLPPAGDVFLGRRITPITRRRIENFKANRRGFWSLWIFLALFGASLFAEFIANDRPLLVELRGQPATSRYCATIRRRLSAAFCRPPTDYRDPAVDPADRREGLDGLAADPVQLPHDHRRARPVPGGAVARPTGSAPTTRVAMCWRG